MPSKIQVSRYTFTVNNYSDDDIQMLKNSEIIKYGIFGKEVGEQGTPHLQGYMELHKKTTIKGVCNSIPLLDKEGKNKLWLIPSKGTHEKNKAYCNKEGNVTEWGKPQKPGKRSDLDAIRQIAKSDGLRAVALTGNSQQIRVAEKFLAYNEKPRNVDKVEVIWIYGPPRYGKSTYALKHVLKSEEDFYSYKGDTQGRWWDGYDGHETVFMDDLKPTDFKTGCQLLSYLNPFECKIQVRGGMRQLRAKKFVITTLLHPKDFWQSFPDEPYERIEGRITKIIWVDEDQTNYLRCEISGP